MNARSDGIRDLNAPAPAEAVPDERAEFAHALARMAKALAHPARVEIVRLLLDRGECVCGEIVRRLPLVQSTVSAHLKQLREAGLVLGRRDRSCVRYRVNSVAFAHLRLLVGTLAGEQVKTATD